MSTVVRFNHSLFAATDSYSLLSLSSDLLIHCLTFLHLESVLIHIAPTCRSLYSLITTDPMFWSVLCHLKHSSSPTTNLGPLNQLKTRSNLSWEDLFYHVLVDFSTESIRCFATTHGSEILIFDIVRTTTTATASTSTTATAENDTSEQQQQLEQSQPQSLDLEFRNSQYFRKVIDDELSTTQNPKLCWLDNLTLAVFEIKSKIKSTTKSSSSTPTRPTIVGKLEVWDIEKEKLRVSVSIPFDVIIGGGSGSSGGTRVESCELIDLSSGLIVILFRKKIAVAVDQRERERRSDETRRPHPRSDDQNEVEVDLIERASRFVARRPNDPPEAHESHGRFRDEVAMVAIDVRHPSRETIVGVLHIQGEVKTVDRIDSTRLYYVESVDEPEVASAGLKTKTMNVKIWNIGKLWRYDSWNEIRWPEDLTGGSGRSDRSTADRVDSDGSSVASGTPSSVLESVEWVTQCGGAKRAFGLGHERVLIVEEGHSSGYVIDLERRNDLESESERQTFDFVAAGSFIPPKDAETDASADAPSSEESCSSSSLGSGSGVDENQKTSSPSLTPFAGFLPDSSMWHYTTSPFHGSVPMAFFSPRQIRSMPFSTPITGHVLPMGRANSAPTQLMSYGHTLDFVSSSPTSSFVFDACLIGSDFLAVSLEGGNVAVFDYESGKQIGRISPSSSRPRAAGMWSRTRLSEQIFPLGPSSLLVVVGFDKKSLRFWKVSSEGCQEVGEYSSSNRIFAVASLSDRFFVVRERNGLVLCEALQGTPSKSTQEDGAQASGSFQIHARFQTRPEPFLRSASCVPLVRSNELMWTVV